MSTAPHPLHFVREFIRSSNTVGAIWPSSPRLAQRIVEASQVAAARTILELGPGDGVVTREILERKSKDSRFLALEKKPEFVRILQQRFPDASIVEGCATNLIPLLEKHQMNPVESLVSGLPWAIFPASLQDAILDQIQQALGVNGVFTTFAYFGPHWLGGGRAFRDRLKKRFSHVSTTPVEVLNLPPAFVYIARK